MAKTANSDELRSFVAFAGYYRRFVKITKPLTDLLPPTSSKKYAKPIVIKNWEWKREQEITFNKIKEILTLPSIVANSNSQAPFELHIGASGKGLGAIFYRNRIIRRESYYLLVEVCQNQKGTSAFKLEYLALKWAVTEKFSDYLLSNQFTVYTDNNPLTHVLSSAKLDATGQRWASAQGQYNFNIVYRAGLNNKGAEAMSRYPFDRIMKENEDRISIDDATVKNICNTIQVDAVIETVPSASVNKLEATESSSQPLAQFKQREIRRSQREDAVLWKWIRATIDKPPPRNRIYSKEDQVMRKVSHSFKMIIGILYREIKNGESTIPPLVLPKIN